MLQYRDGPFGLSCNSLAHEPRRGQHILQRDDLIGELNAGMPSTAAALSGRRRSETMVAPGESVRTSGPV